MERAGNRRKALLSSRSLRQARSQNITRGGSKKFSLSLLKVNTYLVGNTAFYLNWLSLAEYLLQTVGPNPLNSSFRRFLVVPIKTLEIGTVMLRSLVRNVV